MHIDLSHLDQLFRGDQALRNEWIDLYLQESPRYFHQLVEASAQRDAVSMAHVAHDLQPQALYMGCTRMHQLLAAIELQASTDMAGCAPLLEELAALQTAIETELRMALRRP